MYQLNTTVSSKWNQRVHIYSQQGKVKSYSIDGGELQTHLELAIVPDTFHSGDVAKIKSL